MTATDGTTAPTAQLAWTALDCADPIGLAMFYSDLTGWPVDDQDSDDSWIELRSDGSATLAFQKVDDYRAPQWPGQERPQQAHLDFYVDDLDAAEAWVLEIGATKHEVQPNERWRVFLDPAGHPFCLIPR